MAFCNILNSIWIVNINILSGIYLNIQLIFSEFQLKYKPFSPPLLFCCVNKRSCFLRSKNMNHIFEISHHPRPEILRSEVQNRRGFTLLIKH